jgi:hypothetical protein
MALKPAKFKLEEQVVLGGQPFQVAGVAQLELPDGSVATRYLLNGEKGASQIVEERKDRLSVLRPFPPSAAPQPKGNEVSVMGARYVLAGVEKLAIGGAEGAPVGALPGSGLLLSGRFESPTGDILREIAPGGGGQTFYAAKALAAEDLLSSVQHAAALAAQVQVAEQQAAADAETSKSTGGWVGKLVGWIVTLLVIGGLVYACSDSGDSGTTAGARTGSWHYSGGSRGK